MTLNVSQSLTGTIKAGNLPPQGMDPDSYAQNYADQNGISLDEAKEELKSKYGDPQAPDSTDSLFLQNKDLNVNNNNPNGLNPQEQALFEAGVPVDVIIEGDDAIKNFTDENGIQITAKDEENSSNNGVFENLANSIKNFFGVGSSDNQTENPNGLAPEAQQLLEAGVPLEVIQEGDDAIMQFLNDNNLSQYATK